MGLTDLFPMLKELHCDGVPTDPKSHAEVHVDVLSCFFGFLRSCDFGITRQLLKEHHSPVDLERLRIERLAAAFDNKLSKTFDKGATILHFDGGPTKEKEHARTLRATTSKQQLDRLGARLDDLETRCLQIKNSSRDKLVKSWKRSLRKSLRKMLQAWQTTFRINEDGRRQLADKLAASGWRLCGQNPVSKICVGETDLCVAQLAARESAKGNGPVIVASGDSDYLAHDNVVLLRQNPKRRTEYCQYTQQEVISTLNKNRPRLRRRTSRNQSCEEKYPLLSPNVWKVLAIVCMNDYSPNVKGYGPKKNWAILGRLYRRKGVDSPEALLAAYVKEMTKKVKDQQITVPDFAASARVFLDLKETLLEASSPCDPAPRHQQVLDAMSNFREAIQILNLAFFKTSTPHQSNTQQPASRPALLGPVHLEPSLPRHPIARPSSDPTVSASMPYTRHFRRSNNQFKPRVIKLPCFSSDDAEVTPIIPVQTRNPAQSSESKQPVVPEKKRVKTTVNKTSRSQRDAADQQRRMAQALAQGTELKIQQRSRSLGQVINDGMKGFCETVTLSKGDTRHLLSTCMMNNMRPAVEAFVGAGQASAFKKTSTDDQAALCDYVLSAMQEDILSTLTQLSQLSTDLGRICTYAVEHYVSKIMAEHPDISDCEKRKHELQPILQGQSFFRTLAIALYQPTRLSNNPVNNESTLARQVADDFEKDFTYVAQPALERIRSLLDGTVHLTVVEAIGRGISDTIRTQAQHYITTLKTRVIAHAPEWASSVGKPMLDAIGTKGDSKRDDLLSINWFLNTTLPEESRVALFPQVGWGDAFFCISESHLLNALQRKRLAPDMARMVPLYVHLFGKGTAYAGHRGQLIYDLFFGGAKTNYDRTTAVAMPVDPSRTPGAFDMTRTRLSELAGRVSQGGQGEEQRQLLRAFKEAIKEDIISRGDGIVHTGQRRLKYILEGTLQTNGQQVKIQAFHLRHRWPKKKEADQGSTSQGPDPPVSTLSSLSAPDHSHSYIQYIDKVIPDQVAIECQFPKQSHFVVTAIDPGAKKTACSATIDTLDPEHATFVDVPRESLSFSEQLYRKRLEYAKKTTSHDDRDIHTIERGLSTFKLPPPPRWVTHATAAATTDAAAPTVLNTTFAQAGLCDQSGDVVESSRRHVDHAEVEVVRSDDGGLNDQDMQAIDTAFEPVPLEMTTEGRPSSPPASFEKLFQTARTTMKNHIRCELEADPILRSFYGSQKLKYWRYQKEQGRRADTCKAISSLLATAQNPVHDRYPRQHLEEGRGRRALLAIGDGKFGAIPGIKDKSGNFRYRLAQEAKGRGMMVCLVNEFKSSATCSRCRGPTKAKGRSLTCLNKLCGGARTEDQNALFGLEPTTGPSCDRDHNASLNLARASLQQVQEQTWPAQMQRIKIVDFEDGVAEVASAGV
ncbi:hypothetical protein DFQ26_009259 [Actinomortierella ambigua]|nr:hypothetical protein DFQ26_009259 [Actinomortierella ambigua]